MIRPAKKNIICSFWLIPLLIWGCGRYLTERERVEVLRNKGFQHFIKNEFEESASEYITALTLSQMEKERLFNDRALYNYGLLFTTWDRYNSLLERLEKRLVKAQDKDDFKGEINVLLNLGEIYYELQKYPVAWEFFQESLQKSRKQSYIRGFCRSSNYLGKTLAAQKKSEEAMKYFQLSKRVAERFKKDESLVDAYMGIGRVREAQGDFQQAQSSYIISMEDSQRLDYSEGEEAALEALGKLFMKKKDYPLALNHFVPALSAKLDMVDQKGSAFLWRLVGDTYFSWGKLLEAQNAYAQAFRIRFEIKTFYECCLLLRKLGRVYRALKNQSASLYYYERSRLFFKTLGDLTGESKTRLETARYYFELGKLGEAQDLADETLEVVLNIEDERIERDLRVFRAKLYQRKGKIEDAAREIKEVINLDEKLQHRDLAKDTAFLNQLRSKRVFEY